MPNLFEKFLDKESLFNNKMALQSTFLPESIGHREKEIDSIANILAPCLRNEKPSNVFIYGKTGVGKTISVQYIINQLNKLRIEKDIPLKIVYVNCKLRKVSDTEYRLISHLASEFGKEVPATGLPTNEVYKIFYDVADSKDHTILLVLDEIDQLVAKMGDGFLYNLTRINNELKNAKISLIGISNSHFFTENIDPRVKSSLSEEEVMFSPYNAFQLQDILKKRVEIAFKKGVIGEGVIEKCAALAAREHGDARRAIDLLRVAGEIAERENEKKVKIKHLDFAESTIDNDRIYDIITTQPKQFQAIFYCILLLEKNSQTVFTGEVYEKYIQFCDKLRLRPLTQRRLSDMIAEMDMIGIISSKLISKGRHGRMRELKISIPMQTKLKVKDLLEKSLGLNI